MTRKSLKIIGNLRVQFANGEISAMSYGTWKGVVWLLGLNNLVTIRDLRELNKPKKQRRPMKRKLRLLQAGLTRLTWVPEETSETWYKPVDVPVVTEERVNESDFSEE